MFGEPGAHLVGGGPPDLLGEVGGANAQPLIEHGEHHEPGRQLEQFGETGALLSAVEEARDQLRVEHAQPDAGEQQYRQQDHPCPQGAQISIEKAPIGAYRDHQAPGSNGRRRAPREVGLEVGARRPVGRVSGSPNAPDQRAVVGFLTIACLLAARESAEGLCHDRRGVSITQIEGISRPGTRHRRSGSRGVRGPLFAARSRDRGASRGPRLVPETGGGRPRGVRCHRCPTPSPP